MASRKIFNYDSKILEEETLNEYGYYSDKYGKSSAKFIIASCRYCGKSMPVRKGFFNKAGSACHKECRFKEQSESGSPFNDPKVREKAKQTNLSRYGVERAADNPEILKRQKEGRARPEVQKKIEQTNMDKYGVRNPSMLPEVVEKIKATTRERYGTDWGIQNEDVKAKSRETCLQKYGADNPLKNKGVKDKIRDTNFNRYGEYCVFSSPSIRKKIEKTCMDKYGFKYPMQSSEILDKSKATCLSNYGHEHPLQSEMILKKSLKSFSESVKEDKHDKFKQINTLRSEDFWDNLISGNTLIEACNEFGLNYGGVRHQLSQIEFRRTFEECYTFPRLQKQKEIYDFVKCSKPDSDCIYFNDKTRIPPLELDIFIPSHNLAIEFNGSYWHSEAVVDKRISRRKHHKKTVLCEEKGIRLIHIFEYQWDNRKTQWKSYLNNILGQNECVIYARKCTIDRQRCPEFIEKNHIQGFGGLTSAFFNLEYEGRVCMSLTLGVHPRQGQESKGVVLNRLCSRSGTTVVGGASRLFKAAKEWAKEEGYKNIISWSDNAWTQGDIYKTLDFELEEELHPDYFYWDMGNNCYRSKQSQKKSNTGCPAEITERDWAFNNGLFRIYDCGKKRWTYDLTKVK